MRILYIEPFEVGSHAAFGRVLRASIDAQWTSLTLPGRHWKWRARGSAAWFATAHADEIERGHDLVFASAYLPLADLLALCPALRTTPTVLYFHENQLAFPVRREHARERDFHFGFTQLVSAMAATHCAFNSGWNLDSFLDAGADLLARMPDAVPPGWIEGIRAKSSVLPVLLDLPPPPPEGPAPTADERRDGPILLWNHRWEHDKDPDTFFEVLTRLADDGVPFRLAVCGQRFRRAPDCFEVARARLAERIFHWGHLESRAAYEALLGRCHICVSTAAHEFFGISMLESAHFGVRPLVPDRLSYPELFAEGDRYADPAALEATLRRLCEGWSAGRVVLRRNGAAVTAPFHGPAVGAYRALFERLVDGPIRRSIRE